MALQKAKEAGKKERALCKTREQAGLVKFLDLLTAPPVVSDDWKFIIRTLKILTLHQTLKFSLDSFS